MLGLGDRCDTPGSSFSIIALVSNGFAVRHHCITKDMFHIHSSNAK